MFILFNSVTFHQKNHIERICLVYRTEYGNSLFLGGRKGTLITNFEPLRRWQTRTHCCAHIVADTNVSPFTRARNKCFPVCAAHKRGANSKWGAYLKLGTNSSIYGI